MSGWSGSRGLAWVALLAGCLQEPPPPGDFDFDGDGSPLGVDCDDTVPSAQTETTWYADVDGDQYGSEQTAELACTMPAGWVGVAGDCDDGDATVNPTLVWYTDVDEDGYGDPSTAVTACRAPAGTIATGGDCDDGSSSVSPEGTEVCDPLDRDEDCDGSADDEDDDTLGGVALYEDGDGDGFGGLLLRTGCDALSGESFEDGDCDDRYADTFPGAAETCGEPRDMNCDGSSGDADGDADGAIACDDCDDGNSAMFPGNTEVCDTFDNDCDPTTIEGDGPDAIESWRDGDGDGFGDNGWYALSVFGCVTPSGFAPNNDDCDDGLASAYPGAPEPCGSTADFNCDRYVDNADADGDGSFACADCDDGDPNALPGATESCDGVDEDCNGLIDDGFTLVIWYRDRDGDGHGEPMGAIDACAAPPGAVATALDCDDTEASASPTTAEVCDGVDNDCDGVIDDGHTETPFYADSDGDGFGDGALVTIACLPPPNTVAGALDCDDLDPAVHPAASEICNDADDDCDGAVDESGAPVDWHDDRDGDGWGIATQLTRACVRPSRTAALAGDCDDTDPAVYPGAVETCDWGDLDCDGDEFANAIDKFTVCTDYDGDGHGASPGRTVCPGEGVTGDEYEIECDDCDDWSYATTNSPETCNGVDDDCDGVVDDGLGLVWYVDADGDGYGDPTTGRQACDAPPATVDNSLDCDDADPELGRPGPYFVDADGDGFGDSATVDACRGDAGTATNQADCDDADSAVYPGEGCP